MFKGEVANYLEMCSPDLSPVVDAYEHALMARFPRGRYLVGPHRMLCWLLFVLPDWLGDKLANVDKNKAIPACAKRN